MACSMVHLGVFNPRRGLLRVEINRLPQLGTVPSQIDVPVVCLQCDPAPCSEACPEGAIVRSDVGAWVIDQERCISCGLCVDACSYGMITLDAQENGTARKCDLCQGSPSCVEYCPTQALTF
jgi:carbon-monoxide dehydrogenase iron sulfur subunit